MRCSVAARSARVPCKLALKSFSFCSVISLASKGGNATLLLGKLPELILRLVEVLAVQLGLLLEELQLPGRPVNLKMLVDVPFGQSRQHRPPACFQDRWTHN